MTITDTDRIRSIRNITGMELDSLRSLVAVITIASHLEKMDVVIEDILDGIMSLTMSARAVMAVLLTSDSIEEFDEGIAKASKEVKSEAEEDFKILTEVAGIARRALLEGNDDTDQG